MGTVFHPGWEAGLEVEMRRQGGVTRMSQMRHWGPLRVQRPFYPDDSGECHLYVLHPPGGMVTGDRLDLDITLTDQAHTLFTTPSAGKVYRGNQSTVPQYQRVSCRVTGDSYLEWLPQETIVFDGARGELVLTVELDENSSCCLWDVVCLGRPASNERFTSGYLNQQVAVSRCGKPLYLERNQFIGGSSLLSEPWGLGGFPVSGTFLATAVLGSEQVTTLREIVSSAEQRGCLAAVSDLGDLVAVRYLGNSPEECRKLFTLCWRELRPVIQKREIIEPRIWRT